MCGSRGEKNTGDVCKGRGARLPRLRNTRSGARSSRRAVCTECRLRGGTAMHLLQQCAPAYPPPAKCIQWFIRRPPVQNQPCARARCVCVCKHTRESASGAEKAERSWEYFLERIAGTRRIRNLVAKRGEAGTTTSLWEIRSGGRLMELFTVRLIILAIASGSSSLVIGGMGLRGKGRKCV